MRSGEILPYLVLLGTLKLAFYSSLKATRYAWCHR